MTRGVRQRYSEWEFSRAVAISRMVPENVALARAVLVDGRPQASVARETGVGRQRASQIVKKMVRYIEEANPVPVGWHRDSVILPARDWPTVRALEQAARKQLAERQGKRREKKQ